MEYPKDYRRIDPYNHRFGRYAQILCVVFGYTDASIKLEEFAGVRVLDKQNNKYLVTYEGDRIPQVFTVTTLRSLEDIIRGHRFDDYIDLNGGLWRHDINLIESRLKQEDEAPYLKGVESIHQYRPSKLSMSDQRQIWKWCDTIPF